MILNKLLSLLGIISSKTLKESSDSIINVFNKTVVNLEKVNDSVEAEIVKNNEKASKIKEEVSSLVNIRESNTKIINKINEFLK